MRVSWLSRRPIVVLVVPIMLSAAVAATAAQAAAVPAGARHRPAGTPFPGQLNAVTATSAGNAWAVGYSPGETLIERWNGKAWKFVSTLGLGASGDLYGVAALSASDAWAVGYLPGQSGSASLIARWNGKTWKRVKSPNPGTEGSILQGVAATSARNAWAVGETSGEKTLILRWNGTAWKQVPSPSPGPNGDFLYGVTATSATSAWAVGVAHSPAATSTLILHWNGQTWKRVASPSPGPQGSTLYGVSASSPTSAWAVGYTAVYAEGWKTLIEHWNGKTWQQVPSPDPVTVSSSKLTWNILQSVSAVSAGSAWAVGYSEESLKGSKDLILRWNGQAWKQVPSPNPFCATCDSLFGVTARPAGHAWAVGTVNTGGEVTILRWTGTAWKNSPSAALP